MSERTGVFSVDTGGTFTDLVVSHGGQATIHKAHTTPDDPVRGVLAVIAAAAAQERCSMAALLGRGKFFLYGTTHPLNAILQGETARTALLTTAGHPDVLLFREGGRPDMFDHAQEYPEPYVPRALTFEVPERIGPDGAVVKELDEDAVRRIAEELRLQNVEAVAVCLLWSVVNGRHEERIGELLADILPNVPVTLSHRLNPILREYRRASSAAIDASLKPLMSGFLARLEDELRDAGFGGRLLLVSSAGGVIDVADGIEAPIHLVRSGPAMAPVAGRHFALADAGTTTAIVADTGGTSYDVSLVSAGQIPRSRETWLGKPYLGHMSGFPAVDVHAIGAGGGSIASIDPGGLLTVGPRSAGSVPGPACYGRGGTQATVTDACVVLGFIQPDRFLGGTMPLDARGAHDAIRRDVAEPLGVSVVEAAAAVLDLMTERMVGAIEQVAVGQGVDPAEALLVAGGGGAGLNAVAVARRLGCRQVLVPWVGPVLSASGAQLSELTREFALTAPRQLSALAEDDMRRIFASLDARARTFLDAREDGLMDAHVTLGADMRYADQVWDLEVELENAAGAHGIAELRAGFDAAHLRVFGITDPESDVEITTWRAYAHARLHGAGLTPRAALSTAAGTSGTALVSFHGTELLSVPVHALEALPPDGEVHGGAVLVSPVTTVVLPPGSRARRTPTGGVLITTRPEDESTVS